MDLAEGLKRATLTCLQPDLWPRSSAVDQMATEAKKMRDKGVRQPFVYMDVRKFLPEWANDDKDVDDLDEEEQPEWEKKLSSALGVSKKPVKATMPVVQWVAAYDAYALAAAATEQWSYAAAYAHKATCLQIARESRARGIAGTVCVVYDELFRKRLAERTQKNAPNCYPDKDTHLVDEALLKKAVQTYNERGDALKSKGGGGKGSWNNSSNNGNNGNNSYSSYSNNSSSSSWDGGKRTLPWQKEHYGAKRHKGSSKGTGGQIKGTREPHMAII